MMKIINKKTTALLLPALFLAATVYAAISMNKSTNITVDSSELEPFALNETSDDDEKLQFYEDENTAVGFNDQGDPAFEKRF